MLAIQKIEAVFHQLFGSDPLRSPEDWDALCKKLVYLKLAKVHEITTFDASSLLYPITLDNFKAILKTKFANPLLTHAIKENEENVLRLNQLKDLVGRWQCHGLTNNEIKTLLQIKERLSDNLQKQRDQFESAKRGLAQLCEPLIQVKETLQTSDSIYTSYDYIRLT